MQFVFSDTAWSVLETLIEEVYPNGKTPVQNLRRRPSAVFWHHQNGAKWRAPASEFGPWWVADQLFIRWLKLGVWQHFFGKVEVWIRHRVWFSLMARRAVSITRRPGPP
ncbi:transposase [Kozakia baliensis]|uniref:transposase n=1 Tax=Kozakia baliensis TaxID=153496 RepID=UPI001D045805|nr:transposase [Kozakia baliensis]